MAGKVKSVNIKTGETFTGDVSDTEHLLETNVLDAPVKDIHWQASQLSTESETKLEHDEGHGDPVILRVFEFAMNPQAFKEHPPTKQELFQSHVKGIETMLWRDGMKVIPEIDPKVVMSKKQAKYRIFVGARPARGHLLNEIPKTLSQITK